LAAEERDVSGVALVTGGARGIGFEVVRQLAQQGMTVILGARDLDKASAAAEELVGDGLDVRAGTIDVANGDSLRELADWVEGEFGRLDVLVNNAAAFADWSETASGADLEISRAVLDTNLFGEEMGARPIPAGASSVAWAAILPDDGPSGDFFRDGEPMPW
jgi:NAD(P)-dependent dehydrogenase (short-subunit alcohol dehydrogenase family)